MGKCKLKKWQATSLCLFGSARPKKLDNLLLVDDVVPAEAAGGETRVEVSRYEGGASSGTVVDLLSITEERASLSAMVVGPTI